MLKVWGIASSYKTSQNTETKKDPFGNPFVKGWKLKYLFLNVSRTIKNNPLLFTLVMQKKHSNYPKSMSKCCINYKIM